IVYDSPVLEAHEFFHQKQIVFKSEIERREKKSILQASGIVVYSNAVKEYLNKKYAKELPVFIHQNVDYSRFEYIENKTPGKTINIGFIGSFLKWHRVDLLINAFARLKDEGKNVKLFLLGSGMEFDKMKDAVEKNKYASAIEMPGFMDGAQLFEYKKQFDIGVMPGSNWYGAPNKIFEYGAAKIAVVAPDTPTIKDLFEDGKDLLFFKQDDENDLFLKLKKYVDDIDLMNKCAATLQLKISRNYSENITFEFYNYLITKGIK
ncbi:MAG: glycosyltransferase family 4 protein, partial [Bacteroidia bacterium]